MTRVDKILAMKKTTVLNGINPHECNDQDLDRLYGISKKSLKSGEEILFVNAIKSKHPIRKPIGKFKTNDN